LSSRSAKQAALEIAVVFGLIFATIWIAPRLSQDDATARKIGYAMAVAAFVVAAASTIYRNDRLPDVGLRLDNFLAALRLVAIPTLVIAGVILAIGVGYGSLHSTKRLLAWRLSRFLWPFLQQYAMQGFLNRRTQDIFGKGRASVLLTAAIFAGIHAPNPALMIATFLAGGMWAWAFQRQPNLFALTISHMILSTVLGHSLPAWLLPNMKIGWAYWR
jgi:membrane protease YdiL (CAAX protease family)